MTIPDKNEFGMQALDEIMLRLKLSNSDLVKASTEQLTHKMVAKGRKGRRLTLNIQMKILRALQNLDINAANPFTLKELFNYHP